MIVSFGGSYPRFARTSRDPRPDPSDSGVRFPLVGFAFLLLLFPSESAEAIRDPIPGLLVPCIVPVALGSF